MGSPHVLILPYPAQGHVIPSMELSHCLVDRGFEVTFVNTEFNHKRVLAAVSKDVGNTDRLHLISIPDGLGPGEDRNNLGRLCEGLLEIMSGCLEELIRKTNESGGSKITWMITDHSMAWSLLVAKKMGLRVATFWPASAAVLAATLSIPKMIEDGILNVDGLPKRHEEIQLSPGMPLMDTTQFAWNCAGDSEAQKIIFPYVLHANRASKIAEFTICNSFHEIEWPVFAYAPNILPIGPLFTGQRLGKLVGHFWSEDAACMSWLNEQPANSVIYVAFGSFTILNQHQFREVALGLERSDRPFLWVVRPDLTNVTNDAYPSEFKDRVAGRGRIVDWSPQQKVLAHPSVACFLSHCGWNSTMEGVRNGVPFLCWPYFADQFLNQTYICDEWRIGLRMTPDDGGIISGEQIKAKVDELLKDEELRARSAKWKEVANRNAREGGSSHKNFIYIVNIMKE